MTVQASPNLSSHSTLSDRRTSAAAGLVVECSAQGVLLTIQRDDLGLLHGIAPGLPFHHLVERGSLDQALAFLAELNRRGSAFGWELKVSLASHPTTLYVGGVEQSGQFLIFGTRTRGELLRFSRYCLDNCHLEADEKPTPEYLPLDRIKDERDLALQEQLSLTQNHVVNLKEVLARKNARIKQVIAELKMARAALDVLRNMLPICSSCKKIRDEQGDWHLIETYFRNITGVQFTHSICPDCVQNLYPGLTIEK